MWRVKVSREQAQRHYANAAATDSATVKGGLRLHPSQGPRLRAPKHTAFLKAHGAAGWAEGQICSQRLIHNSQRILFWKACSEQKAGLSQETWDSSTVYFLFQIFLFFPLFAYFPWVGIDSINSGIQCELMFYSIKTHVLCPGKRWTVQSWLKLC